MKKLVLHSGGGDSLAVMLDYIDKFGAENIISMGFNYGQRHFEQENAAASRFCEKLTIPRVVLNIPLGQIGGSSLTNHNLQVTEDMSKQRSTVVPQRNAIFILFAAAFAQENNCDTIVHGACREDYIAYRDCRPIFFKLLESTIQAGRTEPLKGSEDIVQDFWTIKGDCDGVCGLNREKIDILIDTPLINEKKEETMARILKTWGPEVYKYSYSCYNGTIPQCGKCPACIERKHAFKVCGIEDPVL